jgi:hypothetical protein
MRPAIRFMRPAVAGARHRAPPEPRLHPGYVILWMTLLALAGVMVWAACSDRIPPLT